VGRVDETKKGVFIFSSFSELTLFCQICLKSLYWNNILMNRILTSTVCHYFEIGSLSFDISSAFRAKSPEKILGKSIPPNEELLIPRRAICRNRGWQRSKKVEKGKTDLGSSVPDCQTRI
jgi:hypothetical protein